MIEFFDVVKKKTFSIIIDSCSIENSNAKIIPEKDALIIYEEWRKDE